MEAGQMVKLRVYGEKEVILKVLRQKKDTLVVCKPEEYDPAHLQGREPKCVGFHIKYLLEQLPTN